MSDIDRRAIRSRDIPVLALPHGAVVVGAAVAVNVEVGQHQHQHVRRLSVNGTQRRVEFRGSLIRSTVLSAQRAGMDVRAKRLAGHVGFNPEKRVDRSREPIGVITRCRAGQRRDLHGARQRVAPGGRRFRRQINTNPARPRHGLPADFHRAAGHLPERQNWMAAEQATRFKAVDPGDGRAGSGFDVAPIQPASSMGAGRQLSRQKKSTLKQ